MKTVGYVEQDADIVGTLLENGLKLDGHLSSSAKKDLKVPSSQKRVPNSGKNRARQNFVTRTCSCAGCRRCLLMESGWGGERHQGGDSEKKR